MLKNQSLERGLAILDLLDRATAPLGIREIARAMDLSPTIVQRLTNSLVAYAIYTVSPDTIEKFGTKQLGLTLPFPLYGIFRYLYLVHQKEGGGSPSDMLQNDRPLLACVALWALSVAAIIYGTSLLNG